MNTEFKATITTGRNALSFDGTDGSHIHLDAPEIEAANVARLVMARNKVLKVTIEWEAQQDGGE